jgi:type IV pilus assembly protein PilF
VKTQPPKTTGPADQNQKAAYHVVQAGENLYRISLRYGLKVDQLLRLNNLEPGTVIKPGQKLLVSSPKP